MLIINKITLIFIIIIIIIDSIILIIIISSPPFPSLPSPQTLTTIIIKFIQTTTNLI